MNQLQFVHAIDKTIIYTARKPTAAEFAEYWNSFALSGGRDNITAQANLVIACRESPSKEVLRDLLDCEWSSLPATAYSAILDSAGMFPLGPKVNEFYGERLDAALLIETLDAIKNQDENPALDVKVDAHYMMHIARLESFGAAKDRIRQWASARNARLTRVIIALPESIGGYYVGRVPSLDDRIAAQRIHQASSSNDESGPFDAFCRTVIDCALFAAPLTVTSLIDQFPGAIISLGVATRELGADSFIVEQKK